jgi:hypothetical protein
MLHGKLRAIFSTEPVVYPADLLPRLQSLLSALADLDCAHERAVEGIEHGEADPGLKARRLASLNESHRQRREPYVRDLAHLEAGMRAMLGQD